MKQIRPRIDNGLYYRVKRAIKVNQYRSVAVVVCMALRMFLAAPHEERMRYRK